MNDAKSNPWAEIKRLNAENANLHFLIEQANGALAGLRGNYDRVRAAFESRTIEISELRAQLTATEEALAQVQRESAELREERDLNRQRVIELQRENLEIKQREVRRVRTLRECDQLLIAYGELGILLPPKSSGPGFSPGFDVKRAEKGGAQE